MEVTIPDSFFTVEEKEKLKTLLRAQSENDFINAMGKIALASLTEYKEMLLGKG